MKIVQRQSSVPHRWQSLPWRLRRRTSLKRRDLVLAKRWVNTRSMFLFKIATSCCFLLWKVYNTYIFTFIVVCCQEYSLLVVEIFQTNIAHSDLLPGIQLAIGGRDAWWGGEESSATTCPRQMMSPPVPCTNLLFYVHHIIIISYLRNVLDARGSSFYLSVAKQISKCQNSCTSQIYVCVGLPYFCTILLMLSYNFQIF